MTFNVTILDIRSFQYLKEFNYSIKDFNGETNGMITKDLYSEFGFDITLTRNVYPYILSYYLPTWCLVNIASMSFIIPPSAIPGRVTLLVTLLLVLMGLMSDVQVN
jgi:hypothetical protein